MRGNAAVRGLERMLKAIKFIIRGIGKILSYLFITLGLWFPALFSIIYFIACGATHTTFAGKIMMGFWVGFIASAIVGLVLAMYWQTRGRRKKQEDASVVQADKPKKKGRKKAETEDEQVAQPQAPYPPYGYYPPPQSYMYPPQPPYPQAPYPPQGYNAAPPMYGGQYAQPTYGTPPPQQSTVAPPPQYNNNNGDLERKYFPDSASQQSAAPLGGNEDLYKMPESYGRTITKTAERNESQRPDLSANELWRRLSGSEVPDEKPLVFRTREDENLFVYEYSDRYQYWRRTKAGMMLEKTDFKKVDNDAGRRRS